MTTIDMEIVNKQLIYMKQKKIGLKSSYLTHIYLLILIFDSIL